MTKQEHINYWVTAAENDWGAVQNIFKATEYIYALFFAHLVYLASKTRLAFTEEETNFLNLFNQFQLEGRYPDYKFDLIKKYKAIETKNLLEQVDIIRICLLKNL